MHDRSPETHHKCHVIATESNNKHYSTYVIKTVNPFPSLWPLTSYIKHTERKKQISCTVQPKSFIRLHQYPNECAHNYRPAYIPINVILTYLMIMSFILKWVSIIPFVRTLARNTSVGVGTYFSSQILSMFSNKLLGEKKMAYDKQNSR